MLTAHLKTGEEICLGYNFSKEELLSLRSKEKFFCPVCGQRVTLKLGNQRIFHFAHLREGNCHHLYERESIYHLDGKRQLFQWLLHQQIPCFLEYYDQAIQQRPDVLFFYNNQKYALEFQCSDIPEKIFMKRTQTYRENGYIPIWILAGNRLQPKKQNVWSLSNFHYLFLKETADGKYYIPSFSPDIRSFRFLGPILSYSVKNVVAPYSLIPQDKLNITSLLNPQIKKTIEMGAWHQEVDFYHYHWSLHQSPEQSHFLHEIYAHNLNPFLLPPEIGIPVYHSIFIENSPVIWQTYFYLDILSRKQPGENMLLSEVKTCFNRRVARGEIMLRYLPQYQHVNPLLPIIEYMHGLAKLGVLTIEGPGAFSVKRKLYMPKNNHEAMEYKNLFYKNISVSQKR